MHLTHRLAALFITVALTAVPTLAQREFTNHFQTQDNKALLNRLTFNDHVNRSVIIGGERNMAGAVVINYRLKQAPGYETRDRTLYMRGWRDQTLVTIYLQRAH